MYDVVIKNGLLYDGYGNPPIEGHLAIKGRIIEEIGVEDREGYLEIDARKKIVSPGFIDIHTHDETSLLQYGSVEAKIMQGVTSVLLGNCGLGFFPVKKDREEIWRDYHSSLYDLQDLTLDWVDYRGFLERLKKRGLSINAGSLMGHGALRIAVMGSEERSATSRELEKMQVLLEESLKEGCPGLSTGLLYPPSSYATEKEIYALGETLAKYGAIYVTHQRNESDGLKDCIEENIQLARSTGVSVQVSHLILSGKENWGKAQEILYLLENARREGLNIHCDQYPYLAGITFITALLPQWSLNKGVVGLLKRLKEDTSFRQTLHQEIEEGILGWDNILKSTGPEHLIINSVKTERNQRVIGKSLQEIAISRKEDAIETLLSLLIEEEGQITVLIFSLCSEDVERILKEREVLVGSDGVMINGRAHPRLYGTYPRIIAHYVRERKVLPLERAIYKMTHLPAKKFGLKERGVLKRGSRADIVIFDYERINDRATYANPILYPSGIEWVLVNGQLVVERGEYRPELGIGEIL